MKILIATILVIFTSITHAKVFRMQYDKPKAIEALSISVDKDKLVVLTIGRLEVPKDGGYKAFDIEATTFKSGNLENITTIDFISETSKKVQPHLKLPKKLIINELIVVEEEKKVIYLLSVEGIFEIKYNAKTAAYKISPVKNAQFKPDLTILHKDGKPPNIKINAKKNQK